MTAGGESTAGEEGDSGRPVSGPTGPTGRVSGSVPDSGADSGPDGLLDPASASGAAVTSDALADPLADSAPGVAPEVAPPIMSGPAYAAPSGPATPAAPDPASHPAPDPAAELARELRAARVEAGLSLKELEPLTASSDSSLSRYLSGASVPPWSVVEALFTAARRDPRAAAPWWEAAQRSRFERRLRAREPGEDLDQDSAARVVGAPGIQGSGASSPAAASPLAGSGAGSGSGAGAGSRGRRRHPRLPVLAGIAVGVVAAAVAVVVAFMPGGGASSPGVVRLCPWHYVVTDGNPAPVNIADSSGPDRMIIAYYGPDQVFYAPEPLQVSNGLMRTVDGWVTHGDWIQRYRAPCITVPATSAGATR